MASQEKYKADDFLDAAAEIFATDGPDGLTLAAVLRATGASSGSLYYRFPHRPALLGALWRRTVSDYHHATKAAFDGSRPSALEAALMFARDTVQWCRTNPDAAAVLLAGRRALRADLWAPELRSLVDSENSVRQEQTRLLVRGVRDETGKPLETVLIAALDMPYAAVRRYITARMEMPPTLENTVAGAMEAILTSLNEEESSRFLPAS